MYKLKQLLSTDSFVYTSKPYVIIKPNGKIIEGIDDIVTELNRLYKKLEKKNVHK